MSEVLSLIAHFGTPAGIFGLTLFAFSLLERSSSPRAKDDFARYLREANFAVVPLRLPHTARYIFETVFGKRHLTGFCIYRSVVCSVLAILALTALSVLGDPLSVTSAIDAFNQSNFMVRGMIISILVWSLAMDYLSLLKTRLVIGALDRTQTPHTVPRILLIGAADFVVGFCIFVLGVIVGMAIGEIISSAYFFAQCPSCAGHIPSLEYELLVAIIHTFPNKYANFFPTLVSYIYSGRLSNIFAILFFASLVPSIWLWLYLASSLLTRVITNSSRPIRFLVYFLDIDHHPIRSVGIVAATLSLVIYLIVVFVQGL